jgi:hypothetical protein
MKWQPIFSNLNKNSISLTQIWVLTAVEMHTVIFLVMLLFCSLVVGTNVSEVPEARGSMFLWNAGTHLPDCNSAITQRAVT